MSWQLLAQGSYTRMRQASELLAHSEIQAVIRRRQGRSGCAFGLYARENIPEAEALLRAAGYSPPGEGRAGT